MTLGPARVIGITIFILLSVVYGTGSSQSVTESSKIYSNPNMPIHVRVGEEFSIILKSNPSTGFTWQLAEPLDKSILRLVGSEYKARKPALIGSGGEEIWIFKALSKGRAFISMEYNRQWEKDVPPAKRMIFTVNVN